MGRLGTQLVAVEAGLEINSDPPFRVRRTVNLNIVY